MQTHRCKHQKGWRRGGGDQKGRFHHILQKGQGKAISVTLTHKSLMEKLVLSLWNFLAICHCLVWCHKSGKNREIMTRERPIGGQQKRERTKEMQIRYGWSVQYMNNPKGCSASVHVCVCVGGWVPMYWTLNSLHAQGRIKGSETLYL